MLNKNNNSFSEQELLKLSEQIVSLVNDRSHKYDNYHYSFFRDIILRLIKRYPDNGEKQYVCITLASLLIRSMKNEFYTRNVYPHGDIHSEDRSCHIMFEAEYDSFIADLEKYIQQSSDKSNLSEENWSLYFLAEYIITELFFHQGYSISKSSEACTEWFPETQNNNPEVILNKFYKHFYGLFPIIDSGISEIKSYLPLKYSEEFCFGYIYYPTKYINTFVEQIPGFLHEICHYVPPVSRKKRNTVALRLLVYTLINRWQNELYHKLSKYSWPREQIQKVCSVYFEFMMNYFENKLNSKLDSITGMGLDSMNIFLLETDFFRSISPETLFDMLFSSEINLSSYSSSEVEVIFNVIDNLKYDIALQNILREPWENHAERLIVTYNILLRELRSDIYMVKLLDINLEKYIELMAKETRFANNDVSVVGDATVYRLGLMTRYLWQINSKGQFYACTSFEEYLDWKTSCISIINNLMVSPQIINNLIKYLDKYCDFAMEQDIDYYTPQYHSLLEEELCDLINEWDRQASEMNVYPSIQYLRKLYQKEHSPENIYHDIYQTSINGLKQWNQTWPLAPFIFLENNKK